jgi:hypothetical protein
MCLRLHVQYSLPDDEHKMFETCRRQEELNYNFNLKSAFCWLTLQTCITMHGTKNITDECVYSFSVDQNLGFLFLQVVSLNIIWK